jgi:mRNA-degrading endonuclease RelE of RelBE toxin-antitoxin system
MTWTVIVAKPARKQLARVPAKDQVRIEAALKAIAANPFSGDIIKLEGEADRWRRRVGNYRIFFAVDPAQSTVAVSAILRRTSTTY